MKKSSGVNKILHFQMECKCRQVNLGIFQEANKRTGGQY